MKKFVLAAFAALLLALAVSACNTVRGMGRDIREAGGGIERAASR